MGTWNPWGGVVDGAAGAPHDVGLLWGPGSLGTGGGSISPPLFDLDAADEAVGIVFMVPKDGTITDVGFYIGATAGAFPDYYVSIETVGADGLPTGADYGGSAQTEFTPAGGAEHRWITLDTPATATAGDIVAAIVGPGVDAPSAGNEIRIRVLGGGLSEVGLPHGITAPAGAWGHVAGGYVYPIAVKYNDGTVEGLAATAFTTAQFDSADTPDEVGCKFTLPMDAKCRGARVSFGWLDPDAGYEVKLYNNADALIASAAVSDEDYQGGFHMVDVFWDEVALTADAVYRLTVLATHATATILLWSFTFPDAASRNWVPEGARWTGTERTDAGAWTDEALEQPAVALWLPSITV